ncbi:hypothetical protein A8C32_18195 [Flavivirga aquatica]|uniref:Uncharacterized protein n=1 Tax=Flavivirga aquatica TaxID=1849968 RepID=A0A1E5T7Q3_9FLAO|nr:hypothetical protein [Flavivirga aquatica]OEK07368.1 hypothetical protein A8C32_18195 [Flavivirga aquatica]
MKEIIRRLLVFLRIKKGTPTEKELEKKKAGLELENKSLDRKIKSAKTRGKRLYKRIEKLEAKAVSNNKTRLIGALQERLETQQNLITSYEALKTIKTGLLTNIRLDLNDLKTKKNQKKLDKTIKDYKHAKKDFTIEKQKMDSKYKALLNIAKVPNKKLKEKKRKGVKARKQQSSFTQKRIHTARSLR